jgi:hypothetical protein
MRGAPTIIGTSAAVLVLVVVNAHPRLAGVVSNARRPFRRGKPVARPVVRRPAIFKPMQDITSRHAIWNNLN